jgi:hypothetical protein
MFGQFAGRAVLGAGLVGDDDGAVVAGVDDDGAVVAGVDVAA